MRKEISEKLKHIATSRWFWLALFFLLIIGFFFNIFGINSVSYIKGENLARVLDVGVDTKKEKPRPTYPPLDRAEYDRRMLKLANNPAPKPPKLDKEGNPIVPATPPPKPLWPVEGLPYPRDGAILPFKRVVAYYGNLYSKKMGVLGEYPEAEMLARLDAEVKKWEIADPDMPVQPALHYIAVVAQSSAGEDGKYRLRMPSSEIDKVLKMAEKAGAIVFLDIQVGFSTLESELPPLEKYFKLPNVHLGIDPEFSMKTGIRPGKVVGTYDASDVNYAVNFLADIVKKEDLPPKILVVHRYTERMLTNYKAIKPVPEVQVVIHMDGWGGKTRKLGTYDLFVRKQPVQFTGFKLFYKNDVFDKGSVIFSPEELSKLNPAPVYAQYQ